MRQTLPIGGPGTSRPIAPSITTCKPRAFCCPRARSIRRDWACPWASPPKRTTDSQPTIRKKRTITTGPHEPQILPQPMKLQAEIQEMDHHLRETQMNRAIRDRDTYLTLADLEARMATLERVIL